MPGSFLLIAGEPGVGKSTLMIEAVRNLQGTVHYYSGEESPAQVKMRCSRMGFDSPGFLLSRETDLDSIVGKILEDRPILAIVDSIQTVQRPGAGSGPGSPGQMREAAMALLEACKTAGSILIVTGHVTKDGAIAGPRILEHMVDTVLYFETDRLNHYRFLRAVKNRFGPVGETAVFEMIQSGLRIVSEIHPDGERGPSASGRVYSVIHHGSRAMTVEVQALVVRAAYGPSRRMADGMDTRRLILISAVLEKFLKIHLSDCDIFANLAGGLSSDEPGLDLALAAAILSSFREVVVDPRMAFVGELGLSGEVRSVSGMDRRIRELAGSGFRKLVVPPIQDHWKELAGETELLSVEHVYQLPGISTGEGEPVDLKKSGLLS